MLNIFRKKDGRTDEMRYAKEVIGMGPYGRIETYKAEIRIFGTLQIIKESRVELTIAVSSDDPIEREVMRDPRIARAIKQANMRGVGVLLFLPFEIHREIGHLFPEIALKVCDLRELSVITADNSLMTKIAVSDEGRAIFRFYRDTLSVMVVHDFFCENDL